MDPEFYEQLLGQRQLTAPTTQPPKNDSDSAKGKPLTHENETLTGQMRGGKIINTRIDIILSI